MALDFKKTFGEGGKATAGQDRPKSQFWLNVGYVAEGEGKEGEDAFVSLPVGMALDSQEKLSTNSSNAEFAQLQAARNDLLDQLLALAEGLEPGEAKVFQLDVQIRRVRNEVEVPTDATNKFARKLNFA